MASVGNGLNRVRSKVVLMESIHQLLEILLDAGEPRVVHWDGRILRMHKLSSRKARQIFQSPQSFPGLLGVYDHNAIYRDIADPLGEMLGIQL
ncbi:MULTISPECIES: hypothetical protein [unclassified Paludibacterium]|uniref:hypothetical protein n=1 Tax=unclassified Paludibacterium TaxID=2618429 RepID=UPI00207B2C90|nr:hypothetical protein [Paludibacterium sp. B53371]BEV72858.1 hypothetical protein THUN1379_23400 [Paludibacterium sp. THUN1379]